MRAGIIAILLLLMHQLSAQVDSIAKVLTFENYIRIVKDNHPVAMQAAMQQQFGDAAVMQAKGGFDPKAYTDINQKHFKDSRYYSLIDAGLKVPTWIGLEVSAGYERNDGVFLNPENNLPEAGLWYTGINLPIGQGLFIDKRRAAIKKAKIYLESTDAMRRQLLNQLFFDAGNAYWNWVNAYNMQLVFENALTLANERYEAVMAGAVLGERPAIDTLEAGIQVQNRQLMLQQAGLDFIKASALLSVFLWADGNIPMEISETTVPPSMETLEVSLPDNRFLLLGDSLVAMHPELQQYGFKLQQLEIEKKLQKEQLKPLLNVKYNALAAPVNGNPFAEYNINNYSWGLEFKMPIILRTARGELQETRLELQATEYEQNTKQASLAYKVDAALAEWNTTQEQYILYSQTVKDYNGLLDGEKRMFEAGESSLFMVNSRELGYINAQLKQIELLVKNRKASLTAGYALGILNEEIL